MNDGVDLFSQHGELNASRLGWKSLPLYPQPNQQIYALVSDYELKSDAMNGLKGLKDKRNINIFKII